MRESEEYLKPGTVLLNRYQVERTFARGGMSILYRGIDMHEKQPVAIKILPEHLSTERLHRRFLREARLAIQVRHPNVVTTHAVGIFNDAPFIVMEFLEGETLYYQLREEGPFQVSRACAIVADLLAGVEAANQCGVIHRDLKPSNVLLLSNHQVKVIDFGLSKEMHAPSRISITRPREALGTPSYMSPEQILAEPVDARTDVYGAGVLLYETLTGRRAFLRKDDVPDEVFRSILKTNPPLPSSIQSMLN